MIHWKHRRSAFSSNQWGIFEEKYLLLKSSVYTGNILSCVKPCAGVKWFRTSKRCVYVYERWLGLTNVARCVCQFYCEGARHLYFTVSPMSRIRKMLSFKLILPVCACAYQIITISSVWS